MRLLSDEAVQKWCQERAIHVDAQRTLRLEGGRYLELTLPESASRVIALGDALLEVAFEEGSGFQGALHWVTGAGIWGSYSESVALKILEQMRTAYGGSRPFSDVRGHLFQATELLDAQAFLTHSMLFGWDAYLIPARAPANCRRRRRWRTAGRDEAMRNLTEIRQTHEYDQCSAPAEPLPIDLLRLVARDKGDFRCETPVGERNAGIGRHANRRGNSRNDFKPHARLGQSFGFLSPAAEDVWISTLQTNDLFAGAGITGQHAVNFFLRLGVLGALLADVHDFSVAPRVGKQARSGQVVVEDHIGPLDEVQPPDRYQPRIAGAGADQIDHTRSRGGVLRRHANTRVADSRAQVIGLGKERCFRSPGG